MSARRPRPGSPEEHLDVSVVKRTTMNGKPVYEITVNTVINFASGFGHKRLCDYKTFSFGTACAYSCGYCYVLNMVRKHPEVQRVLREIEAQGLEFRDVVMIRLNALDILLEQLTTRKPRHVDLFDGSVIYASPLVDVAANLALANQTVEACRIILELTNWTIRLLSKSNLLPHVARNLPERFRDRVIYGVSTGTLDDKLAATFEEGTALVSKRVASLHWLQDHGFRTYAMICPSLPQEDYDCFARDMARALRVERCEHVWAEVINGRDDVMANTAKAMAGAGFGPDAERLRLVTGPGTKPAWEAYARATFEAHARVIPPEKLRVLQYVTRASRAWWQARADMGAILLGKAAEEAGK